MHDMKMLLAQPLLMPDGQNNNALLLFFPDIVHAIKSKMYNAQSTICIRYHHHRYQTLDWVPNRSVEVFGFVTDKRVHTNINHTLHLQI